MPVGKPVFIKENLRKKGKVFLLS